MKEFVDLFSIFFQIGAFTFGGGYTMLPILQKEIVEKRNWCTEEEIMDYYAIAQSMPGIIAVNTVVFIGYKVKGIYGAIAAMLGIITPSIAIILFIAAVLQNFMQYEIIQKAFAGIRVGVAALVCNAAFTMFKAGVKSWFTLVIFVVTLLLLVFIPSISPVIIILAAGVISIIYRLVSERSSV